MPPEKLVVVSEWMTKALQDLEVAQFLQTSLPKFSESIAFHAQQSAEKSLKGFLTSHDTRIRKVHDMEEIGSLVSKVDASLQPIATKVQKLSRYAVGTRYPGEDKPVSPQEAQEALAIAEEVYREVLKRIPIAAHPTTP